MSGRFGEIGNSLLAVRRRKSPQFLEPVVDDDELGLFTSASKDLLPVFRRLHHEKSLPVGCDVPGRPIDGQVIVRKQNDWAIRRELRLRFDRD